MKHTIKITLFALLGAVTIGIVHLILGVADAASAASSIAEQVISPAEYARRRFLIYTCIVSGGLLGGLIYSISRNRGFVVPKHYLFQDGDNQFFKLGLGTFADMLVGLGGSILIFLLVPYTGDQDLITTLVQNVGTITEASSLLKVVALALVGGFAGISLFDEAAKRLTHQIEELDLTIQNNRERIHQINDTSAREAEIQYLLSPLLDVTIGPLKPEQEQILIQKIASASINTRNWVFTQVQRTVDSQWIMGEPEKSLTDSEVKARRALFKQLIVPFQALVRAAEVDQGKDASNHDRYLHRYLAHIAFCQEQMATAYARSGATDEALMNWRLAQDNLAQAVQVRDAVQSETGRRSPTAGTQFALSQVDRNDAKNLFWHYELHQVLCSYKMSDMQQAEATLNKLQPFWQMKSFLLPSLFKNLDFEFLAWLKRHVASQEVLLTLNDILAAEATGIDFHPGHSTGSQRDPEDDRSFMAAGISRRNGRHSHLEGELDIPGLNDMGNGHTLSQRDFDDGHA